MHEHESNNLISPRPPALATLAILLHGYWAVHHTSSTPLLYAIHHTRLVITISCKSQPQGLTPHHPWSLPVRLGSVNLNPISCKSQPQPLLALPSGIVLPLLRLSPPLQYLTPPKSRISLWYLLSNPSSRHSGRRI